MVSLIGNSDAFTSFSIGSTTGGGGYVPPPPNTASDNYDSTTGYEANADSNESLTKSIDEIKTKNEEQDTQIDFINGALLHKQNIEPTLTLFLQNLMTLGDALFLGKFSGIINELNLNLDLRYTGGDIKINTTSGIKQYTTTDWSDSIQFVKDYDKTGTQLTSELNNRYTKTEVDSLFNGVNTKQLQISDEIHHSNPAHDLTSKFPLGLNIRFNRNFTRKIGDTTGSNPSPFCDSIQLSTWVDHTGGGKNQICISKNDDIRMILKRASYNDPNVPYGTTTSNKNYKEVLMKSYDNKLVDNNLEISCKSITIDNKTLQTLINEGVSQNTITSDSQSIKRLIETTMYNFGLGRKFNNITANIGWTGHHFDTIYGSSSVFYNFDTNVIGFRRMSSEVSYSNTSEGHPVGEVYFARIHVGLPHQSNQKHLYILKYRFNEVLEEVIISSGQGRSKQLTDAEYDDLQPYAYSYTHDLTINPDNTPTKIANYYAQSTERGVYKSWSSYPSPPPSNLSGSSDGELFGHSFNTNYFEADNISVNTTGINNNATAISNNTTNINANLDSINALNYGLTSTNNDLNSLATFVSDMNNDKFNFTEAIQFNYPTLSTNEEKLLMNFSSGFEILCKNNYYSGQDDLIIRRTGESQGINIQGDHMLVKDVFIKSRDPSNLAYYQAVSWEDFQYLIEQSRVIDSSKKVSENSILQFSDNAVVKSSPAPICYVDENGKISSARLYDSDFDDQVLGVVDPDGDKTNQFSQGLVPGSNGENNKFLRADGQWSVLETPDISAGVKVENQSNYFFNIEVDGGSGSTQPSSGLNFRTNDGHPIHADKNQPVYIASQFQSGWESGEDAWKDAYLKIKTHESNSSLTTTMLLKQNKVYINPSNDSIAASEALEVNGNVKCSGKFIGDGSELSGIPKFDTINDSNKFVITNLADGGRFSYINPTTNNIPEGSNNKYYTDDRFDIRFNYKMSSGTITNIVANQIQGQTIVANSDIRLKENIKKIEKSNIEKLIPVEYNFKNDKKIKRYGFIAQDIEEDIDSLIYKDSQGYLGVNYMDIIALLVKDNQDLHKRLNALEEKII